MPTTTDEAVRSAGLVARVEVLLRRARPPDAPKAYVGGRPTVGLAQRVALIDERDIDLTPQEFKLSSALVAHAGQVLPHKRLLELVWGCAHALARQPEAVRRLRATQASRPQ